MHTLESPENKLKLEFASKVGELNTKQYLKLCHDFLDLHHGRINEDDFMVALIYNVLEMKPQKSRRANEDERSRMVIALEQLATTLFSFWHIPEGSDIAEIDWFFTDQKLPVIEFNGRYLYGPASMLEDLTYGEYEKAHTYFSVYLRTQDEAVLDKLIAVLYRPLASDRQLLKFRKKKQERVGLQDYDLVAAEKWVSYLPPYIKYAVFIWWNNMEQFIQIAEIQTDAGPVNLSALFKKSEEEKTSVENNTGIRGVLYQLAESAVFGDMKQVEAVNFWDVMLRLYQLKMNHAEDRERMEKLSQKQGGQK